MFKRKIEVFLLNHNIPLHKWGQGESKTIEHLCEELSSGESVLVEKDSLLFRLVEEATLDVYHVDDENVWLLREKEQVFKGGRSRTRVLSASIGEKMKKGEDPAGAAHRALSEELGISEKLLLIPRPLFVKGPVVSSSFPGLYSVHTRHIFDVFLPLYLYQKEGYVEKQDDKSSFFVWEKFADTKACA